MVTLLETNLKLCHLRFSAAVRFPWAVGIIRRVCILYMPTTCILIIICFHGALELTVQPNYQNNAVSYISSHARWVSYWTCFIGDLIFSFSCHHPEINSSRTFKSVVQNSGIIPKAYKWYGGARTCPYRYTSLIQPIQGGTTKHPQPCMQVHHMYMPMYRLPIE